MTKQKIFELIDKKKSDIGELYKEGRMKKENYEVAFRVLQNLEYEIKKAR